MKLNVGILALCALAPVANAFTVQTRRSSTTFRMSTPSFGGAPASQGTGSPGLQSPNSPSLTRATQPKTTREVFDDVTPVIVQGGSLRTCSFLETVDRVTVCLKTDGRPLNANVDLWQGPDNTPQKMSVYLEDGSLSPFRAVIESPGSSNTVSIRNTGMIEFPLVAGLEVDLSGVESPSAVASRAGLRTIQGGAVYTVPFPPSVQSVVVMLKTDGRPLNARLELLQGPNNKKQEVEVYTEDGNARPFYVIVDTPKTGNTIRIQNTATVEFPISAAVAPYIVDESLVDSGPASGGMTWS